MGTTQPDDPAALVRAALGGDEEAWDRLVRRFIRLVTSVIRGQGLSPEDAQDVTQVVWLRLVEHLPGIREPVALPRWLIVTTLNACREHWRTHRRSVATDPQIMIQLGRVDSGDLDAAVLADERHQALVEGLAELPTRQRELLTLLASDPPRSYAEIAEILHMPVGSIGPSRRRALEQLRQAPSMQRYIEGYREITPAGGDGHDRAELE